MKKKIILTPLICLIFLIHCSHKEQSYVEETILKEKTGFIDLHWRKEKSVDVSGVDFAYLYPGNETINVYGYSTKQTNNKVLKIYDSDLNLESEKSFNIGEGPGDLGGASYFHTCGDYTYVPDNTQRKVNIFDKGLNFVKFVKTPAAFLSPMFIKSCEYFIATRTESGQRGSVSFHIEIISFPDFESKRLYTVGPTNRRDKNRNLILGAIPQFHYFHRAGKIYIINMKTYQIMVFDLSGKMLKRIRVEVDKIPVPSEMRKTWLKEQVGPRLLNRVSLADFVQPVGWMVPLGNGFVVIRRNGYSTSCEDFGEGDYFDYDLQPLGKVKFPCFFGIHHLLRAFFPRSFTYDGGYVYLITQDLQETDENINLEKWQVVE